MTNTLLIEIGVEELPAIPFLKELPNIKNRWQNILKENLLDCEFSFFYTPRRLVFWHREFKESQEDRVLEQFGAPLSIAYKDGKPTNAALGFAKKCDVDVDKLSSINKGKGEILYCKKKVKGNLSKHLLDKMVNDFIVTLNFGKSMRWGSCKDSFIRPIRGLSIVLGDKLIDGKLFGIKSNMNAFAHRMVSYDKFDFLNGNDYFCKILKNGIILNQQDRKELILNQMAKIEKQHNVEIEKDEELLCEIVAITEYPTALIGSFDKEFLELPKEVIIGSMKEHQRYFAIYDNGKITNKFIVVSNAYTKDFSEIISGNEKVLRPRLADAMFFWKNDLKTGLQNEGLKQITFVEGLGSVYDKCLREVEIASKLADMFDIDNNELLENTIMIAKSDLLTDMVYEFTDLQGIMGYYYAKEAKEDEQVCLAIKEQYLPNSEDSDLPSNIFSSIVALSNKLDTLMGLFSINMIPTGSRDPFALRRAASGIIRICIEHKLPLDLNYIINQSLNNYTNLNADRLLEFFNDRLIKIYNKVNPSVIKSVLKSDGVNDIVSIDYKLNTLNKVIKNSDFKKLSTTFKRISNIIKDIDTSNSLELKSHLFTEKSEIKLYKEYRNYVNHRDKIIDNNVKLYSKEDYDKYLNGLLSLIPSIDNFFEEVFINHKDEDVKTNRKNLIGNIYQDFKTIADIKEITI